LARLLGLNAAIMYGEILSKWNYFSIRDDLTDDGFFYNTIEDMQGDTTLGRRNQVEAIKILVDANLIEYKVAGMPAKRFFKVNEDESIVLDLLKSRTAVQFVQNEQTSLYEMNKPVSSKRTLNNTNSNNTKNKTNGKDSGSASSQKTLIPLPERPVEMTRSETAIHKIKEARAGRLDWKQVNDTNFTYYYIDVHNRLFKGDLTMKDGRDVSMLKNGLFLKYDIPRHLIPDVIDELLKSYSVHPKNERGMLGFMAIENDYLPKGFIQSIVDQVIPVERKYNTKRTVESEGIDLTGDVF
jgi:hypothetical protein